MEGSVLPLQQAAEALGVSRRRVQALVETGALPAERIGVQWVVPAVAIRRAAHTMRRSPGRPLHAASAWRRVEQLGESRAADVRRHLNLVRRDVRPRAEHLKFYVHTSLLDELRDFPDVVVSGRDAAAHAGAPVDPGDSVHLYIRTKDANALLAKVSARPNVDKPNLHLHVVPDDSWPFDAIQRVAPAWVAWLDLEDEQDRAADAVLDRLLGGRALA